MEHFRGLLTPAEALYKTFLPFRPLLRQNALRIKHRHINPTARRTFIDPRHRHVAGVNRPKRAQDVDPFPDFVKNRDITSPQVHVLNRDNMLGEVVERDQVTRLLREPKRLKNFGFHINHDALSSGNGNSDEDELFLVQIGKGQEDVAICKIMGRKLLLRERMTKNKRKKEQAKIARSNVPKDIELNWAISDNDLNTKLRLLEAFLGDGKKVRLILANKKRQRKATQEEAEKVLNVLKTKFQELEAREFKEREGKLLQQLTMHVENKS